MFVPAFVKTGALRLVQLGCAAQSFVSSQKRTSAVHRQQTTECTKAANGRVTPVHSGFPPTYPGSRLQIRKGGGGGRGRTPRNVFSVSVKATLIRKKTTPDENKSGVIEMARVNHPEGICVCTVQARTSPCLFSVRTRKVSHDMHVGMPYRSGLGRIRPDRRRHFSSVCSEFDFPG